MNIQWFYETILNINKYTGINRLANTSLYFAKNVNYDCLEQIF